MKKSNVAKWNSKESAVVWITTGLAITTLFFQTNLADPFNSPKMWVLMLLASWLTGYLYLARKIIFQIKSLRQLIYLLSLFALSCILVSLKTDFGYVAIFGETQRRNGLLTYLSLSIIMLVSAIYIRNINLKRIYNTALTIGAILVFYGFLQTTGNDFVKWNNPYNSIISTVGNPNFAAAVMAIIGVLVFASLFINQLKAFYRILAGLISGLLLILIYLSDAKQGLLAFILGCSVFSIFFIWQKNKKLGVAGTATGFLVFVFALMGMLQSGPLEKFLYKPSVSVRGYYWRAGIEMLKQNPIWGVGFDRYGAYFKQFREVGYPLSYGFDITSTNAHNTFIQFFATGGFLLGISYILINIFVFYRALIAIKKLNGEKKMLVVGVFSAWIAFHAQSLVSIDNIGISIWGWVLGGALIGLSISATGFNTEQAEKTIKKANSLDVSRVIISGALSLLMVLLVAQLYRGENNSFKSRVSINPQDQNARSIFKDLELKTINTKLIDPTYKLNAAMALVNNGFPSEGLNVIKEISKSDPRNQDALNAIALISEQIGQTQDAINARLKMSEIDPWNAVNYLALGKLYKATGDTFNSKKMLDKILSFASNDPISQQAKSELA